MRAQKILVCVALFVAAVFLLGQPPVAAQPGTKVFQARLDGYHETPASLSTNGDGAFRAKLNAAGTELEYELAYTNLEGGSILFAHVHIGQVGTTGGVMFFLCGGGKPACPNGPATVTGTVIAADVIGPAGQGIAPGEFDEAIRAMRSGAAYANVHTMVYPTGEIRGQINEQ